MMCKALHFIKYPDSFGFLPDYTCNYNDHVILTTALCCVRHICCVQCICCVQYACWTPPPPICIPPCTHSGSRQQSVPIRWDSSPPSSLPPLTPPWYVQYLALTAGVERSLTPQGGVRRKLPHLVGSDHSQLLLWEGKEGDHGGGTEEGGKEGWGSLSLSGSHSGSWEWSDPTRWGSWRSAHYTCSKHQSKEQPTHQLTYQPESHAIMGTGYWSGKGGRMRHVACSSAENFLMQRSMP